MINLRKVSVRWDNPGPAPFTRKYEDMAAKVWGAVGYHHKCVLAASTFCSTR